MLTDRQQTTDKLIALPPAAHVRMRGKKVHLLPVPRYSINTRVRD